MKRFSATNLTEPLVFADRRVKSPSLRFTFPSTRNNLLRVKFTGSKSLHVNYWVMNAQFTWERFVLVNFFDRMDGEFTSTSTRTLLVPVPLTPGGWS